MKHRVGSLVCEAACFVVTGKRSELKIFNNGYQSKRRLIMTRYNEPLKSPRILDWICYVQCQRNETILSVAQINLPNRLRYILVLLRTITHTRRASTMKSMYYQQNDLNTGDHYPGYSQTTYDSIT